MFTSSNLILLYHIKQLTGGGHEEICDKKVGYGTKLAGNHWVRRTHKSEKFDIHFKFINKYLYVTMKWPIFY